MRTLIIAAALLSPHILHAQEVYSYLVNKRTGVIEQGKVGYYTDPIEIGQRHVITTYGDVPIKVRDANGLPRTYVEMEVRAITGDRLYPYFIQHLSEKAERALENGEYEEAQTLLRQMRGLQAKQAEDTESATETGADAGDES